MYVNKDLPPHLGGHDNETHLDSKVLDYMIKKYQIKSFLDVGCGPGGMCELAASKGLNVLGIDGDFTIERKQPCIVHDYTLGKPQIDEYFDLAWSCEFLEHVEEQFMENYMDSFKKCKYVIATHAYPGQWGHHHVNCKDVLYWKQSFAKFGFKFSGVESLKIRDISSMKADHLRRSGCFFINENYQK